MKTLTTSEALIYIQAKTGKTGKPLHRSQLNQWQQAGLIVPHTPGGHGKQKTFTVAALDELCDKVRVCNKPEA